MEGTSIVAVIITGIIVGLLGKFLAPGDKDNIPIWLTLVLGIAGAFIGYWIAAAVGVAETSGPIDWIRLLISIVVAAILVMIASTMMGRNTTSRGGRV